MFTRVFWKRAAERAAKTAAQAAVLAIGADAVNAFQVAWVQVAGFAVGGAVLSLLTSVASVGLGDKGSPSLVHTEGRS